MPSFSPSRSTEDAAPSGAATGDTAGSPGQDIPESELLLSLFVQHMPAAVAMVDAEDRYVMVSSRWITDFNLRGEELTGASHFDYFEDPDGHWKRVLKTVKEERVEQGEEARLVRTTGQRFWVRWEVRPWYRSNGERGGSIVFLEDKTARKEAEEALQVSKDLLSSVLISSLDGIMVFQAVRDEAHRLQDLEWVLVNPRAEEMLGYPADRVVGQRLKEEVGDRLLLSLFDDLEAVAETGQPLSREVRVAGDGDAIRWFHITAVRVGDGLAVTYRDISESKEAERKLRESEARYRMLGENMMDLVCLHDPEGHYEYVSSSVKRILGYTPQALEGQTPYPFIHPDDAERLQSDEGDKLFSVSPTEKVTYRMRTSEGSYIWLETSTKIISDADGAVEKLLTSSREVSDRVRAERAMSRTNRALEQRNRELQDFAYVASHDLQEPLRKIRAFADLLIEDFNDALDDTGRYYLERMQDGAKRMSQLISDLLDYSRITTRAQPFEPVDLNKVMHHVISDLELRISDVEASIDVDDLPTIEGDETQIRQLLQNLVGNALKFYREDTRPVVRVEAEELAPAMRSGDAQGPFVRIRVIDNGIGFDEKYLDRIFTPFQRLHNRSAYAGTGMGLAICRRIVERHDGELAAESVPGQGSTFTITLPKRQPKPQPDEAEPGDRLPDQGQSSEPASIT